MNMPKRASRHHAMRESRWAGVSRVSAAGVLSRAWLFAAPPGQRNATTITPRMSDFPLVMNGLNSMRKKHFAYTVASLGFGEGLLWGRRPKRNRKLASAFGAGARHSNVRAMGKRKTGVNLRFTPGPFVRLSASYLITPP